MKRAAIATVVLVLALVLPIVLMGALLVFSGDQSAPSKRALAEIPSQLIDLYRSAAQTCHGLDWTVLAAIHKLETNFGRGAETSSKGAQGPMQFMPSTFSSYGVDGNGDGRTNINSVDDAVFSAANLLCTNGASHPARLAHAIWDYNHSQAYVNQVLALASDYGVLAAPGGAAYAAAGDLLHNPRVIVTPYARGDLQAGIVDRRLVALLSWISQRYTIGISVFKTDHSKYVAGTNRVSNHYYGRAADIFFVDGKAVSVVNQAARRLVLDISRVTGPLRPDELGQPFGLVGMAGAFTDADHQDHIHIGYRP